MLDTRSISINVVVACALWAMTLGLFVVAAGVYAADGGRLAILIAEAACIVSAAAAAFQVKHYGQKVCDVVRDRDELADDIRRLQRVR